MTVKPIPGQPDSAAVRASLAAENRPVLLAFSGGKDAVATWLALRDAGVEVIPYYMYYVSGLSFVEEQMATYERFFRTPIHRLPHESLYRWLNHAVFQAPERLAVLDAARLPDPTYAEIVGMLEDELGLPGDTWIADGVRAADSIIRRTSFATHGVMKPTSRKVSPIWDWTKAETLGRITEAGIDLPVDYEWFGRSFDGLDRRFLEPLAEHAPADYERIIEWFPLAALELQRGEVAVTGTTSGDLKTRRRREDARARAVMDSEYWICACFQDGDRRDEFARSIGVEGPMVSGERLSGLVPAQGSRRPARRSHKAPRGSLRLPDPLADVVYRDDLESDSLAELEALRVAFRRSSERSGPFRDVTDSPHWLAFHWPSRAAKRDFLARLPGVSVGGLGDKYVDGAELARRLAITSKG